MFQTTIKSVRMQGYSQVELIIGFSLVALLMLGLLVMVNPFAGEDSEIDSIPSYRAANAFYIQNALDRQRVAIMGYQDMHGDLPGDSSLPMEIKGRLIVGNGNARIESGNGEKDKVFPELFQAGINAADVVRIRGKSLELSWVELKSEGKVLGVGHFFKLPGVHTLEARAYDLKFDDGSSDTGDVVYSLNPDGGANLYVKLNLYK